MVGGVTALWIVIGYPVLGLMVMFLWTMNACKLVEGLVFYKDEKKCKIQLIGLYVINAFYLPTLLEYVWLQTVPINGVFYFINVVFLIYNQASYKGKLKFPYIYLICVGLIPLLFAVIPYDVFAVEIPLWIMYTLLTVVLIPVAYYIIIRKSPVPEEVMKHINRREGTSLPSPRSQVYTMDCGVCGSKIQSDHDFCKACGSPTLKSQVHRKNCKTCGAVIETEHGFCKGCGTPTKTLENDNNGHYPREDEAAQITSEQVQPSEEINQQEDKQISDFSHVTLDSNHE